jgi:hypothetical protein
MKITEYSQIRNAPSVRKKIATGSTSSFSDVLASMESGTTASASEAASLTATGGVDVLLSLQEVSEETTARKQVVQQGHALLDSLEALRHSLLMGAVPMSVLTTLEARLNQQRLMTNDPRLHEIMDDIELRVAVELAKWEMR